MNDDEPILCPGDEDGMRGTKELLDWYYKGDRDQEIPDRLGEFRIIRAIDHGGMGIIYEAMQDRLDRRVAVKTIRGQRLHPMDEQRFLCEQKVLALLHHTHIVPIYTAGREGAIAYFAMPFIDGASVRELISTVRLRSVFSEWHTDSWARRTRGPRAKSR